MAEETIEPTEATAAADSTFNWINTWLYDTFGFVIPDIAFWIAIGVIVAVIIALVAWGFFKELKNK